MATTSGTVAETAVYDTELTGLARLHRGKVRDLYALDDDHMLIVATDRLSAFDVVLPDPIPGKGRMLNQISLFWFARTTHIIANHLTGLPLSSAIPDPAERSLLEGRAVIVRRLRALPIEAVVRGYLIGSGWNDYRNSGAISGVTLPAGLQQAQQLPAPIFTPSTKAPRGKHDENIPYETVEQLIGAPLAAAVRERALELYRFAAEHARTRGIIIADTKFEFGVDPQGALVLIDEVLTPDSSRFWPAETWRVRQAVRARLSGNPGLEQAPAGPAAAARGDRAHRREISRSTAPTD